MLKKNSLLYKIPIIIFSAITPLIMYLKKIKITGDLFNVYNGVHSWSDFFNYYKMVWIIISFLLILVLFMSVKDSSKWRDIWRPVINKLLISLAVLIVLSSLFSSYKYIVVFGFVDRYEGLLVQLAYIFFTIYIGYIVESYDDLKPIITGIVISSTVVGVIGVSEFFGYNILSTT
jgi:glucan phosphoethanolaminetransferase (alkaline phosphatase superfamily)